MGRQCLLNFCLLSSHHYPTKNHTCMFRSPNTCCTCLQVSELQQKMSRFHGLQAANPERKSIASTVQDGCESLKWQVRPRTRQYTERYTLPCIHCVLIFHQSQAPSHRWLHNLDVFLTLPCCNSIACLQLNELENAVNRAAEQPQRFNLTPEEITSRKKWVTTTRKQVSNCRSHAWCLHALASLAS